MRSGGVHRVSPEIAIAHFCFKNLNFSKLERGEGLGRGSLASSIINVPRRDLVMSGAKSVHPSPIAFHNVGNSDSYLFRKSLSLSLLFDWMPPDMYAKGRDPYSAPPHSCTPLVSFSYIHTALLYVNMYLYMSCVCQTNVPWTILLRFLAAGVLLNFDQTWLKAN